MTEPLAPVPLGRSALKISRVAFGAMTIGTGRHADQDRVSTLRAAIDAGITSIDTAPLYDFGRSEAHVGEAIRGHRDSVQILTKVGLRWDDPQGELLFESLDSSGRWLGVRRNSRPSSIRLEVDASLVRLGVERLDLVQVHHRDRDTPIAETMGVLLELRQAGKLAEIGVSNYTAEEIAEAAAALGDVPLASVQSRYNLLRREIEEAVLPATIAGGIGHLCYSPLEQSLLTDRCLDGRIPLTDPRASRWTYQPRNMRLVGTVLRKTVLPIAARHDASVAQVALAWLLAQEGVTSVVTGASSVAQVESNARAAAISLGIGEVAELRRAIEALELDLNAGPSLAQRSLRKARVHLGRLRRKLPV